MTKRILFHAFKEFALTEYSLEISFFTFHHPMNEYGGASKISEEEISRLLDALHHFCKNHLLENWIAYEKSEFFESPNHYQNKRDEYISTLIHVSPTKFLYRNFQLLESEYQNEYDRSFNDFLLGLEYRESKHDSSDRLAVKKFLTSDK